MRILLQFVFQIMASEQLVCQKIFFQRIWFCCQWIFFRIVTLITNEMIECIPWNKILDSLLVSRIRASTAESSKFTWTAYLSSLLRKGSWQSMHISSSNSFGWKNRLSRALLSPVRNKKPAPVSTTLLINSILSFIYHKIQSYLSP